jgi:hypothetical protein
VEPEPVPLPEPDELAPVPVVLEVALVPELVLVPGPEHAARLTAPRTTIHRVASFMRLF